jgi:glucose-1-phosphate cytidylyltransferase
VKVVILTGGTRLAEETDTRPKPMVEVGDRPVLWHIMKHYEACGFAEFCVALGYKGEVVKRYFHDYALLAGTMTVQLADGKVTPTDRVSEEWTIHLVDAGGTRTPADAWAAAVAQTGRSCSPQGTASRTSTSAACSSSTARTGDATITAVRPPALFGEMVFGDGDTVHFTEAADGRGLDQRRLLVFEPAMLESSRATTSSRGRRARAARGRASWSHTSTTSSGSASTRCVSCGRCGACGTRARRRG